MTTQFSWLSYLDVADHLARQSGEGFYRSSVSRAYYGVFSHIRDTLQRQGSSFSIRREVHGQVIDALRGDPRPTVVQLARNLDRLRRQRNRADYRTNDRFDRSRALNALSIAENIRDRMVTLFP